MDRSYRAALMALVAVATTPWALPTRAGAEWLVLRDGTALEIQGAPETRGRLVVFRTADGGLASMKLDQVDLEASRRRTLDAVRREGISTRTEVALKEEPKAVFVVTDADVGHVKREEKTGAGEPETQADSSARERGPRQQLAVAEWSERETEQGVQISGVLENRDGNAATAVRVTVVAVDGAGEVVGTRAAALDRTTVLAGQSTPFSALFPGSPRLLFETLEFNLESIALKAGSGEGETGDELGPR